MFVFKSKYIAMTKTLGESLPVRQMLSHVNDSCHNMVLVKQSSVTDCSSLLTYVFVPYRH